MLCYIVLCYVVVCYLGCFCVVFCWSEQWFWHEVRIRFEDCSSNYVCAYALDSLTHDNFFELILQFDCAMLCCARLCYVMLFYVSLCNVMLCYLMFCCAVFSYAM